MTARRYVPAALAAVVTVVFAYLAVRDVDFGDLQDSLADSNYWWLVPAGAMLALGFLMRVVRWRVLFARGTRPALWPMTETLLVGQFLNNVLPLRAGDAARVLVLHSLTGRSRAETAGTVVIERVFDVLALLLLLFVALPWYPEVTWLRAAALLAVVLLVAVLAAIVVLRVYGERPIRFLLRPLGRLPFLSPRRVEAAVLNTLEGVVALRSARVGLIAFAWTVLSWLVLAVSFWLALLCFDFGLSPAAGLLVVIATSLSLLLPSAPAAVGVFEAAAIVALAAYGVPQTQALSYALIVHALNVLPFVLAGLVVLNVERGILKPAGRQRRDERLPANDLPLEVDAGAGIGDGAGRTRDHEDDVTQPADGHLDVDELRKAQGGLAEHAEVRPRPVGDVREVE
jgi:glycosyltransferase 2 family protein